MPLITTVIIIMLQLLHTSCYVYTESTSLGRSIGLIRVMSSFLKRKPRKCKENNEDEVCVTLVLMIIITGVCTTVK